MVIKYYQKINTLVFCVSLTAEISMSSPDGSVVDGPSPECAANDLSHSTSGLSESSLQSSVDQTNLQRDLISSQTSSCGNLTDSWNEVSLSQVGSIEAGTNTPMTDSSCEFVQVTSASLDSDLEGCTITMLSNNAV